jgi:hypothetical protein
MLESTVGLLGVLFLTTLTLVIGFCIVGSIVAALLAVCRGSSTVKAAPSIEPKKRILNLVGTSD